MAHVEKRGRGWVAIYPNPANKSGRGARTFDRKTDAERFLAVTTTAQLRNEWVDPKAGKRKLGEYAETWVAARDLRPQTRELYTYYLKWIARIGHLPLSSITPSVVESWQAGLKAHLADTTANTIRGILAAILKGAVRDQLIPRSPMAEVAPLKVDKKLVHPLPTDTVLSIAQAFPLRWRSAIWLGAGAGLRRGEAFGLTRDRCNFLRREITVDRQVIQPNGCPPYLATPKTRASVATVPMFEPVARALTEHLERYEVGPFDALFTARRGGLVRRAQVGYAWRAAGAPDSSRFHDLRHHFASVLIDGGASIIEVQTLMRHATAEETLGTYSHLFRKTADRSRMIIDAAFPSVADVTLEQHS